MLTHRLSFGGMNQNDILGAWLFKYCFFVHACVQANDISTFERPC